jgi:hypothetical protein
MNDNNCLDGTPLESADYRRGCDDTFKFMCYHIDNILDGKDDGRGQANEPWESLRRRLMNKHSLPQPFKTHYYLSIMDETITGLSECRADNQPANYFDLTGKRLVGGTWPSWFKDNHLVREISKQDAARMILDARKRKFYPQHTGTYFGKVVKITMQHVVMAFDIAGDVVEYVFPNYIFKPAPIKGSIYFVNIRMQPMPAGVHFEGQHPIHKRKNVVPLPRVF